MIDIRSQDVGGSGALRAEFGADPVDPRLIEIGYHQRRASLLKAGRRAAFGARDDTRPDRRRNHRERQYLMDLLDRCGGNLSKAAREAGVDRKTVARMLKRHGIKY